ncbi:serine hydrolase family protein [Herbaspirillum sp. HC18]|nr:serine hydrolase family protein [Herbaspirillum sp. HC18]
MSVSNHTLIIVPGHGNSGPGHWQTLLEQSHPRAVRVMQKNWNLPVRWSWARSLDRTLSALDAPAILVGHSAGAMTIVHWAARSRRPVLGALLVAPPDMEARLPGMPPPWVTRLAGWAPIPMKRLPWPSIVVGSSNDAMCSLERAQEFARAWGSRFVDLGPAGHVNTDAGFGAWPGVHSLIASLISGSHSGAAGVG